MTPGDAARIDALERTVAELAGTARVDVPHHARWTCDGCGGDIGWYDPAEQVVRLRGGALVVYVRLGMGGSVTVTCPRCAQPGTLAAEDVAEVQGTSPSEKPPAR